MESSLWAYKNTNTTIAFLTGICCQCDNSVIRWNIQLLSSCASDSSSGGSKWVSEGGCVENRDKEEKTCKQDQRGTEDEGRVRK